LPRSTQATLPSPTSEASSKPEQSNQSLYTTLKQRLDAIDEPLNLTEDQVKALFKAAALGDPEQQYRAGQLLRHSADAEKRAMGYNYFAMAANEGHAKAAFMAGNCLRNGWGRPASPEAALKWYEKAAQGGYALAWLALGVCHETGFGAAKSESKAVAYYQKGVDANDADCKYHLGRCYMEGRGGLPVDRKKGTELMSSVPRDS
jgi:TPR repeat protein